jgi:Zn-dependent protease
MGQSVRLGRLLGVSIHVDLSWALLFLLAACSLHASLISVHPEWGAALSRGVACAGALLLLAAIVTHELARVVVGRWLGLSGGSVRLFLFGDASWGERRAASPNAEIGAASAGPVVGLGVGLASLALVFAGVESSRGYDPAFASLGPAPTLLAWWGVANLGLGLVNLLPAFPLDGGRLVRALLWKATGDVVRASRIAAALGQVFALALFAGGAAVALGGRLPGVGSGLVAGLWMAFLGWFVHVAACRAARGPVLGRLLDGAFVSTVMRTQFVRTAPDATIESVVDRWLLRGEERAVAVVEGDLFVGLITMADALTLEPRSWSYTEVSWAMTPLFKLETVTPDEPLDSALARMVARDVSQLPVFEDGSLVGMLCRADVARFLGVNPGPPRRLPALPWAAPSNERRAA